MPSKNLKVSSPELVRIIREALREDDARRDMSTKYTIPATALASANIKAKQDLILAGVAIVPLVFRRLDRAIRWISKKKDGQRVRKGEVIGILKGRARALLSGERTALNFLTHLSGIATYTRRFVEALRGTPVKILDTRKTLPGLRALEKYAVRVGGGWNHRSSLSDAVLIKNNHIAVCGSIEKVLEKAPRSSEIEVRNFSELRFVLKKKVKRVLFDHFPPRALKKATALCRKVGVETEASGNITLRNIRRYRATGVDFISIGSLTHSAPAADIHAIGSKTV